MSLAPFRRQKGFSFAYRKVDLQRSLDYFFQQGINMGFDSRVQSLVRRHGAAGFSHFVSAIPEVEGGTHTLFSYLPRDPGAAETTRSAWLEPKDYFESHPDFFSMWESGQRVYHWINYLNLQDTATWYPSLEQIEKMAGYGATMLILHQHWMLQGGSNGNPHADYTIVRDEPSIRRVIDDAHRKGLRVGLYRRGIERYSSAVPLFGKYLQRDWDGFYVDWHGPHCVAIHENCYPPNSDLADAHYSKDGSYLAAREYFLFTRRLRELVGPEGFLIGHQGIGNSGVLANLPFDGYLPGEAGSDHAMFSDIDNAVYQGMMGGGVCMPWPLDSPLFSSPEGMAKMAAWGMYPHVGLGLQRRRDATLFTLDPDDEVNRFALPYWRLLKTIDVGRATVYNLPSRNQAAASCSNADFRGLVYREHREEGDIYLLVVANLADRPGQTTVTLAPRALRMTGSYQVLRIDSRSGVETPHGTSSGEVETSELPPWGIEAYKLQRG